MSALDQLDDGFPHGTLEGYRRGCRGSSCGAALPCRDVYRRYNGDFGFRRLVDAGTPLEEILRRDAAEREGIEQRDKAAARAAKRGEPAPRASAEPRPRATTAPKRTASAPAAPAPVDPLQEWEAARAQWRAQRKELYGVLRAAEQAIARATADRDRAQAAFDEFVAAGEPSKPELPRKRRGRRDDIEAEIRRLHAAGLTDAEAADELGVTRAYAGIVRRDLQLPANTRRRAPGVARTPREPRQVLGHGTNASYARGCRCDECKDAQRAYHRAWMASRREAAGAIAEEHHGTAYGYQLGCRSRKQCPGTPSCPDASLAEERRRRRQAGIPAAPPRVDAEPVRAHVRDLMADGMTLDAIAAGADVGRSHLGTLLYGRSGDRKGEFAAQIDAEKAQRLLALKGEA